jgi:O-antigen/teichoic acid export membrane protein
MGIVKKQVYKNAFVSYAGMVIGYVNLVLLYQVFLTTEQYGLYSLLIGLSVLYSLVASVGVPSMVIRYFPFFKTDDKKHNGFVWWVAGLACLGFLGATVIYLVARPLIFSYYIKESPLFIHYFYFLIPLAGFTVLYNVLEALGKAVYQSILSSFLREVGVKVLTAAAILTFAKGWITFEQFILIYVISNGVISLCLLASLAFSGKFSFRFNKANFTAVSKKEVVNYGLFALLASSVSVLFQKIDILMLSGMAGLAVTGVYNFYSGIALVINVPAAALSRTTYQIVADAWKSKNMKSIADIYAKTSIIQMVVGCLLFIGVIINKDNLFDIIKKEYSDHFNLFIIIGLSCLVDITGGLNTHIIITSHKYKLVTKAIGVASVFCIGLTYILIPLYGGVGAALAYLITIAGFNFFNWLYIKQRFNMQPFSYKHILVIAIAVVCYFAGNSLWKIPNVYLDIIVRSGLTTILYTVLCYYLNISADLNEKVHTTLRKLGLSTQ